MQFDSRAAKSHRTKIAGTNCNSGNSSQHSLRVAALLSGCNALDLRPRPKLLSRLEMYYEQDSAKIEVIKKHVKSYYDFPKPGVIFRDIFPLFLEPQIHASLHEVILNYAKRIEPRVECVASLEARGFLFGPILALNLQVPFIPIRKKGKLPGNVCSVKYSLEYGQDELEIQEDSVGKSVRVLVVDDMLATGGSLQAACQLIEKCGGEVASCLVIIEYTKLAGKSNVPKPVHSILQY